jgi:outer membrane protein
VVLNREAVVMANPAMDLSPAVVTALNAKLTQFAIERARLDQPASAAPAVTQTPSSRK